MVTASDSLIDSLRTGDILLFAGYGLTSIVIRLFTRSPWSHIGMVVRLPGEAAPLLMEAAGSSDCPDSRLGQPVAGVALVPVAEKLRRYPGTVALRRREGAALSHWQHRLVERLIGRLLHRPYKNYLWCNALDLLSGYRRPPDRRGWFCSELVAEFYRRLGWLPREVRVAGFVPGHFACPRLALRRGSLSAPLVLKASGVLVLGTDPIERRRSVGETLPRRRSRGYA